MDDKQRIALVETNQGEPDVGQPLIRYQLGNHLGSASVELDDEALIFLRGISPLRHHGLPGDAKHRRDSLKRYRYTGKERDEESGSVLSRGEVLCPVAGQMG